MFSNLDLICHFFHLCLQHTSLSPDGKLVTIVGDNPEGLLVDSQTGKVFLYLFLFTAVFNFFFYFLFFLINLV